MENNTPTVEPIDLGHKSFGRELAEYFIVMVFLYAVIAIVVGLFELIKIFCVKMYEGFKKQPEKILKVRLHNETWFYDVVEQDGDEIMLEDGNIVTKEDIAELVMEKQNV